MITQADIDRIVKLFHFTHCEDGTFYAAMPSAERGRHRMGQTCADSATAARWALRTWLLENSLAANRPPPTALRKERS